MLKKIALVFVSFAFILTGLQAQMTPEKAIKDLKKGVLIVRLKSDFKKIEAMKQRNMTVLMNQTVEKRDTDNRLWMEAFEKHYEFSEILFSYDTLGRTALKNGSTNCFLNSDFETDPSLSLDDRPFLMLYWGSKGDNSGLSPDGLVFRDSDFQVLKKPFPNFVKISNFNSNFNKLIKTSNAKRVNMERVVKKINKRLSGFYERKS